MHLQPALFPERVFAVVHIYGNHYRPECEPCQWIGLSRTRRTFAAITADEHNASHHAG